MTIKEAKEYLNNHLEDTYYANKMLDNSNEYCSIADLAMRFIMVDREFGHTDWNLEQILANIRVTKYSTEEEIAQRLKEKSNE